MNALLTGSEDILVKAILGVLGLVASYFIAEGTLFIKKKKEAEILKLGVDTYNAHLTVAENIFNQAKSAYKLIPGSGELKANMFDKLLLAKFPKLTQVQIDHCREAIYGKTLPIVNEILAPAYDPLVDESDVKVEAENIEEEVPKEEETVVTTQEVPVQ